MSGPCGRCGGPTDSEARCAECHRPPRAIFSFAAAIREARRYNRWHRVRFMFSLCDECGDLGHYKRHSCRYSARGRVILPPERYQ